MTELFQAIDLKQLGITGVLLGWLMYQNHCLRQDRDKEREYSKSLDERFHAFALKSVEATGKMEQAFIALKDVLR